MNYTKISLTSAQINEEIVNAIFEQFGFQGVQIESQQLKQDYLVHDPSVIIDWSKIDLPNNPSESIVSGFWPDDKTQSSAEVIALLTEKIDDLKNSKILIGDYQISQQIVAEEDWSNNWKPYFHPIKISDKLFIVPTWEDDSFKLPKNAKKILLDPGMAFGTGSHPTTILALQLIEKYLIADQKMLDLGTGSGILTIAASLLGANQITATDIDQNSVNVAKENIQENKVTNVELVVSDLFSKVGDQTFDLIVANILPDILSKLIPDSGRYLKQGGLIILGGINQSAVDRISKMLIDYNFEIIETKELDGWFGLVGVQK